MSNIFKAREDERRLKAKKSEARSAIILIGSVGLFIMAWLTLVAAVIYVAFHFITKYW